MTKIGMISLGCPKNQIDAEMLLFTLQSAGYIITPDEADADVIIVNTCGFIEAAKTEAIENILEAAAHKKDKLKALIVTGCLSERYRDEIYESFPEVDAVVGIGDNAGIAKIVENALEGKKHGGYKPPEDLCLSGGRILTTPPYTAYLKIADGCDNCCTYCAIPAIRGRFRSRPMEEVVEEAKRLAENGVKELIVVAQDTTMYGQNALPALLEELCKIDGLHWIRTLYTYPDKIEDELIDVIARQNKLVPYLDIPIQHCCERVLRDMNRPGNESELRVLIEKLREKIPDITLRTTLITGFPGETEEDFEKLAQFVKDMKFDRLGCFAYSAEEGTPAADFDNQVDEQVKTDRAENIMREQLSIAAAKNEAKIGQIFETLVEGYDNYIKAYFGRTAADAPDIDGKVFFMSERSLEIGEFYNVLINDTIEYDLLGELADFE